MDVYKFDRHSTSTHLRRDNREKNTTSPVHARELVHYIRSPCTRYGSSLCYGAKEPQSLIFDSTHSF